MEINTNNQSTIKKGDELFLDPPSEINGKTFSRVICEYRVPGKEDEISVKGFPNEGGPEEAFILRLNGKGKVGVSIDNRPFPRTVIQN